MGALIFSAEIAAGFLIDRAPLKIRFPEVPNIIDSLQRLKPAKMILFFGSSRFGNEVSAEAVTGVLRETKAAEGVAVFNAFIPAGDPVVMEFLTDKLLAADIHPSIAVIEVLPEVLSRRNLWLHFHLARQFRWSEVWRTLPDAYLAGKLSQVIATRFNAVYLFRGEFQRWATDAAKLRLKFADLGDGNPRKRPRVNRSQPADAAALLEGARAGRKNLRDYQIGGLNAWALDKMIERYSRLGSTVVLIGPPVSSPYRTAYQSPIDDAYLAYMRRLGKTYGTYFFDYRDRLSDGYFYTPYYTTTEGKLHFSRLLAREVLVPLVVGTRGGDSPGSGLTTDNPPRGG
jgi:hypothetical protein